MNSDTFPACLAVVIKQEGGFSDDPKDSGGATNLGVTREVWQEWLRRPVSISDIKALTPTLVAPLYRTNYWQALGCANLAAPLALCVFDFAVNGGPRRAAAFLQHLVGADEDGHVGDATLKAAHAFVAEHGIVAAVKSYQAAREAYYRSLPQFPRYGNGWLSRVSAVTNAALEMQE